MSNLILQERTDGYRVVRADNENEMIASVQTKRTISNPPGTKLNDRGERVLVADNPYGANSFVLMPREEWTIHSSGGPLTVGDIEEILANLTE